MMDQTNYEQLIKHLRTKQYVRNDEMKRLCALAAGELEAVRGEYAKLEKKHAGAVDALENKFGESVKGGTAYALLEKKNRRLQLEVDSLNSQNLRLRDDNAMLQEHALKEEKRRKAWEAEKAAAATTEQIDDQAAAAMREALIVIMNATSAAWCVLQKGKTE